MKEWYKLSISKLSNIVPGKNNKERLINAFDVKYGNYDYSQDLRTTTKPQFSKKFKKILNLDEYSQSNPNILVVGANSGNEIEYLGGCDIVALDLSYTALKKLSRKYPFVRTVNGDMQKLPFRNNSFDYYINLRSSQSKDVDLEKTLEEAVRVTKPQGKLIFSIPTGYFEDGEIIQGLWDSKKKILDTSISKFFAEKIKQTLENDFNISSEISSVPSEIFITAIKSDPKKSNSK